MDIGSVVRRISAVGNQLLSVGLGAFMLSPVAAQCATAWAAVSGVPGSDWGVQALTTLPNGHVVAGGEFTAVGNAAANQIAQWDGATWSALGSGTGGGLYSAAVRALVTLPDGSVVAGGEFTTAGGLAASCIALWNGNSWAPMGAGMDRPVRALATLPNGDVIAGGEFNVAGGVAANRIARWDGTSWSAMGSGMDWPVDALTTLPNGDVIAGGRFQTAGGVAAPGIARWNGTSWVPLGAGMNGEVRALVTLPNGDVVAGGSFTTAGSVRASRIARWDGSSWSELGPGTNGLVLAVLVAPNGDLVVGGEFTAAGGVAASRIARWNGSTWAAMGAGVDNSIYTRVSALAVLPNAELIVGGDFWHAGGKAANHIARWDGTSWSPVGAGIGGSSLAVVYTMTPAADGSVVIGGSFTKAGDIAANCIVRWDGGSSWTPLGAGVSGGSFAPLVIALTTLPNGDVIAGGHFTFADGVAANHIARWDGAAWSALGLGMRGGASATAVYAMTAMPNGDVVAGGEFTSAGGVAANRIARWNGASWSPLGSGMNDTVHALATLPNGDLVAAGAFTTAGGVPAARIARWDGTSWSALGTGMESGFIGAPCQIWALATLPNGDLIAGGNCLVAGGVAARLVARWDGLAWSSLGTGMTGLLGEPKLVSGLTALPNGDVVAVGAFTGAGGVSASGVARWSGGAWSALGAGIDASYRQPIAWVSTALPNGDVLVGGHFFFADGEASAHLARLTTTCPAAVVVAGGACPGSGGANGYEAQNLPWTGSTYRTRGTGLAPNAFVAVVTGFSATALPLHGLLPVVPAGCSLLATPDALELMASDAGTVDTRLPLPNTPALAGLRLHQQLVVLEFDEALTLREITSSNALVATVGTF